MNRFFLTHAKSVNSGIRDSGVDNCSGKITLSEWREGRFGGTKEAYWSGAKALRSRFPKPYSGLI